MERKVDLKGWKPENGPTGVVLWVETPYQQGSRGRLASILHTLPVVEQSRINLDGSMMHADLADYYALVNNHSVQNHNSVRYLKYVLQGMYPEVFGEQEPLSQLFLEEYKYDLHVLENFHRDEDFAPGYHKLSCAEPIILEPEDHTKEQWACLCTLCGADPGNTARLRLNLRSIEVYIEDEVK